MKNGQTGSNKTTLTKLLFTTYTLLFIADITTTLMNGPIIKLLETNPIYKYVGITGIIILNLIVLTTTWYAYDKLGEGSRFCITTFLIGVSLARIGAIQNAIYWIKNPITIAQATKIATPQAKMQTIKIVFGPVINGMMFSWVSYFFWRYGKKCN